MNAPTIFSIKWLIALFKKMAKIIFHGALQNQRPDLGLWPGWDLCSFFSFCLAALKSALFAEALTKSLWHSPPHHSWAFNQALHSDTHKTHTPPCPINNSVWLHRKKIHWYLTEEEEEERCCCGPVCVWDSQAMDQVRRVIKSITLINNGQDERGEIRP